LFNPAFLASFGVYETVKIDQGRPFYLAKHLGRLLHSAQMLELETQVDVATLANWFELLIQIDPKATWSLKILALGALEAGARSIIGMQALPLPTYPDNFYRDGAAAVLYHGQRALPTCKSLNTLVNYLAGHAAHKARALEGLLHYNGYLTEGARSSFFAIRQGQLITCPEEKVLPGITRDIIAHVMQETDYPMIETDVPVDLSLYDEAFISSTSMHVMPITKIDGRPIGDGRVGPITKIVMERFNDHYRQVMERVGWPGNIPGCGITPAKQRIRLK